MKGVPMELVQKKLISKKTGKPFIAYCFRVGEYESPIFFPSPVELTYIKQHLGVDE